MPVLGELNERAIFNEDEREAVNETKSVRLQGWVDLQWIL